MPDKPIFSVCHATARPEQWRASYAAWAACEHPETVEYILAVDERWGFDPSNPPVVNERTRIVWCKERKANVVAWNESAVGTLGKVIIANSDDMRPPKNWDTKLLQAIPDLDSDYVVEVSSGPLADNRRLMVIYILSRKRYERLGYIVNPAYKTIWGDNEFSDRARQDEAVVDARNLEFHHYHPGQGDGLFKWDAVYEAGNMPEDCTRGRALYESRKAAGFPPVVSIITPSTRPELLKEAMESVRKQTFVDIEHLWVTDDNGSGPGFTRNELVKRSNAEWLVFLDDDDLLDPQFIARHLDLAVDGGYDMVYSLCRWPEKYLGWRPEITAFNEARLRKSEKSNYIPVTVMLRRSMFNKVGGCKVTAPHEDWRLWIDLLNAKAKFGFLPEVLWTYRVHGCC